MSVATSTAIVIGGIAAAGASTATGIYAAHKEAEASKQASNVQVAASDKMLAYQQQQQAAAMNYINQMRTAPISGLPAGSAGSYLSQLMHVPGGSSALGGGSAAPPTAPSSGYQFAPSLGPQASGTGAGQNLGYASLLGSPSASNSMPPSSAPSAPNSMSSTPNSGGMVMLQAPNGEQRAVPMEQAQAYIAAGARRIG